MSTTLASAAILIEVPCPVCLKGPKPMRRVIIRAAKGSIVEGYCRHCKYRKVHIV